MEIFVKGIPHPEGIAVDERGWLYTGSALPDYSSKGPIFRISPDGKVVEKFADTGGRILGLAFDKNGILFTCDVQRHAVIAIDKNGRSTLFANKVYDRAIQKPNFIVFDQFGNLIVSDSGTAKAGDATGAIYLFTPDGYGQILLDNLIFPNGLAFDPEFTNLFVVLTRDNCVIKIPISKDGGVGEPLNFAEGLISGPDGIAVHQNGEVYVTITRPSQIIKFSAKGEKLAYILDTEDCLLAAPSNIAFNQVEADKEDIFIANLFGNHISCIKMRFMH